MVEDLIKLQRSYPLVDYRRMVKASIYGMLHEPVFNSLHRLEVPTLVIFGEKDALIPAKVLHPTTTRKIAEEGTAQIPQASLHLIPDCGHFVQWEKANEVNELIRKFIK
jgi:pimeloyl-ACP methyl ester carboxylesterase